MRILQLGMVLAAVWCVSQPGLAADPSSTPAATSDDGRADTDAGPLPPTARRLLAALTALAAILGGLLYVIPSRAVEATRRRIEAAMIERTLTLQEEDRRRIARDLHDGVGQALTAARLHLSALKASGADPQAIALIVGYLDEALAEVRHSTSALAPPALAELGLSVALRRHCDAFAAASAITVRCDLPEALPVLKSDTEIACYRIVQEALSNVARHAQATQAWVRLRLDATDLRVEVGDDGIGLTGEGGGGMGLGSMRERASLVGGSLELVPGAQDGVERGARIRVTLPIAPSAERRAG